MPDLTHIRIPAGTLIVESRAGTRLPEQPGLRLASDLFVDATRLGNDRWAFTWDGRTFSCQLPADAARSVDAALVTNQQVECLIDGRPYLTGLLGSRLVESEDDGVTWRFWTGC